MNLLWWAPRESNPAPTDYEFLRAHLGVERETRNRAGLVARVGRILPTTYSFATAATAAALAVI